jgi:hypothetical protein
MDIFLMIPNRNGHLSYDSAGKALLCLAPLKRNYLAEAHDSEKA